MCVSVLLTCWRGALSQATSVWAHKTVTRSNIILQKPPFLFFPFRHFAVPLLRATTNGSINFLARHAKTTHHRAAAAIACCVPLDSSGIRAPPPTQPNPSHGAAAWLRPAHDLLLFNTNDAKMMLKLDTVFELTISRRLVAKSVHQPGLAPAARLAG